MLVVRSRRTTGIAANHGERREQRRDEHEEHRDHRRHHRDDAADVLVVAVSGLEHRREGVGLRPLRALAQIGQVEQVHALDVAARHLRAERHRPVDPCADFGLATSARVGAEARRDLERDRDARGGHLVPQVCFVGQRRTLMEVAAAGDVLDVVA
jgi:hypothetical protein